MLGLSGSVIEFAKGIIMSLRVFALAGLLFTVPIALASDEISPEELERWFNSDSLDPPRYKESNDGILVFLDDKPRENIHHHHNALKIYPDSLTTGWISLEQCHENIDKVQAAQILFKEDRIRDIKILDFKNIKRVWIDGPSVQMEDIDENARVCISAFTHSLIHNTDGSYTLRNGPYMRRFFDSYFPLRVTMDLDFSDTNLELVQHRPEQQAGYDVQRQNNKLHIDTVFEGKLVTEFQFRSISN